MHINTDMIQKSTLRTGRRALLGHLRDVFGSGSGRQRRGIVNSACAVMRGRAREREVTDFASGQISLIGLMEGLGQGFCELTHDGFLMCVQ